LGVKAIVFRHGRLEFSQRSSSLFAQFRKLLAADGAKADRQGLDENNDYKCEDRVRVRGRKLKDLRVDDDRRNEHAQEGEGPGAQKVGVKEARYHEDEEDGVAGHQQEEQN
jgi:hypothetical protein